MIDIVCLKWGDKFGAEYVNNLFSGIERNTTVPFKFHCFTDDTTGVLDNITCHKLPDLDITGWWYKLWLFSDEMPFEPGTRIMFFDLDTIVTGNIDDILEYDCPKDLIGLENFYNPESFASGLLMWKHGTQTHIWQEFVAKPRKAQAQSPGGDQEWTERNATQWTLWQEEFSGIYSYKQSCSNGLPADAKIVCYHGTPSVIQSFTETVENWDSKNRNGGVPYHPQTWVKSHWYTIMNKYYIFGLQRSGTNFLEKLCLENFDAQFQNVIDGSIWTPRRDYPDYWKHNIDHCESMEADVPVIVVYKNPYLWIESLCFRNCVDWVKRQQHYDPQRGSPELIAGANRLNVQSLAQAYKHWCETWLDKGYTEIVYEDMLIEDSLTEILDDLGELFGANNTDYVTTAKKVFQSELFTESHRDYYLAACPEQLTAVQIATITETLGEDLIDRLGYEPVSLKLAS